MVLIEDRLHIFHGLEFRRFAELGVGTFKNTTHFCEQLAQLQVSFQGAGPTANVVYDDNNARLWSLPDELNHPVEAGPVDETSGDIVLERLDKLIAFELSVGFATCELALKA